MKALLKHSLCIISIMMLFVSLSAQTDSSKLLQVQNACREFVNDPTMLNASVGICFRETASGKMMYSENIHKSLIPASTMKLFTSFSALNLLGPDFRFSTRLEYDGYLDEAGTLHGNIYIIGGGDPSFCSIRFGKKYQKDSVFFNFQKAMQAIGIRNVDGDVIADGSVFDSDMVPYNWSWADIGNYYGAGVCGLNIYENEYSLTFTPADSIGKKAIPGKTDPEIPGLEFANYVNTAKPGGNYDIFILGSPYEYHRRVEGEIAVNNSSETIRGSIPDPEYFTAFEFFNYLKYRKCIMNGKASSYRLMREQNITVNKNRKLLYIHSSPKLTEIIRLLNLYSINLYAESLLKMMAVVKYQNGSYESGVKAVKDFLTSNKIDLQGYQMFDGSGMTRANTFTPNQMSSLLQIISKSTFYNSFLETLPVAGNSGTLSKFASGTILENNFRAKTGTMYKVKSYCGFLKNAAGKSISVVIMVNNYSCSNAQLQEKIEKMLVVLAKTN